MLDSNGLDFVTMTPLEPSASSATTPCGYRAAAPISAEPNRPFSALS